VLGDHAEQAIEVYRLRHDGIVHVLEHRGIHAGDEDDRHVREARAVA
jgi:type IV secretory pathway ATPase VirB11/archaellum biosynthesis ATPase